MTGHSHHRSPGLSCLLCQRTFLFRQVSVPAFVISQVALTSLAADPMRRAIKVSQLPNSVTLS